MSYHRGGSRWPPVSRLKQPLSRGYTIIEVMIFLAISGIIFAIAVAAFNGQQGRTGFEQNMHDLASRMQEYVDQVGASLFPGSGSYACSISASSGRAVLTAGGGGQGTNQGCIFLGRAVQVIPGQSKLFIYTVLGDQFTPQGETVTSFNQALPEPEFSSGTDLTDEYDTPWATVSSSKVTLTSGGIVNSDLVGFYNSLQDYNLNSQAGGGASILAKGYNFVDNDLASVRSAAVKSCIEEQNANGVTCANTPTISLWSACFASTGSSQTALLNIASTPAGITADVNFTSCQ